MAVVEKNDPAHKPLRLITPFQMVHARAKTPCFPASCPSSLLAMIVSLSQDSSSYNRESGQVDTHIPTSLRSSSTKTPHPQPLTVHTSHVTTQEPSVAPNSRFRYTFIHAPQKRKRERGGTEKRATEPPRQKQHQSECTTQAFSKSPRLRHPHPFRARHKSKNKKKKSAETRSRANDARHTFFFLFQPESPTFPPFPSSTIWVAEAT